MVKSTEDYDAWKKELEQDYITKFPNHTKVVKEFIEHTSKIYDTPRRSYLPKKVLWYLYNKTKWARKNNTHIFIAIIGRKGGEGKSTLGHNICYFMDSTYTPNRVSMDYTELLRSIRNAIKEADYPSIQFDEPDNRVHQQSKQGQHVKAILERIRQLHLTVVCCANSLSSIPPFIFERVTILIHIDDKHRFWLWDNAKDKPYYSVIEDIKNGWSQYKHSVFKHRLFVNRAHFKNLNFSPDVPFDLSKYLQKKNVDLIKTIDDYFEKYDAKDKVIKKELSTREEQVLKLIERGITDNRELANKCCVSRGNIRIVKTKLKKKGYSIVTTEPVTDKIVFKMPDTEGFKGGGVL
jgi:hypothetical protein